MLAAGAKVLDLGMVPTPLLYFSAVHFQADGGVMITGSHNPPEYNGFKTVCGTGTLHGEQIQQMSQAYPDKRFGYRVGSVERVDAATPYVDEIAAQFNFSVRSKLVVDAGNGTAGPVAHRVFSRLNVKPSNCFSRWMEIFPIIIPTRPFWKI